VTGQAGGGRGPGPALGGTGRVADELYLMTHHELTGRPHLAPRAVGLGLAGALLTELILAGAITVEGGTVASAWPERADDPLTAAVAGQLAAENPPRPVGDWLAFLARTAAGDVAARLARAGYLAAQPTRPWRAGRWVPVNADCAFAPVARLKAALNPSQPGDVQAVALAGLAAACGLAPWLALYLPPGSRARTDALVPLLASPLREVITQTQAAVDAAVLAHRI
jgi:Golgi phosphoprotein 3 (GPP34)